MKNILKRTFIFLLCLTLGIGTIVCNAEDVIGETAEQSQESQTTSQYADFLQNNSNLDKPLKEIIVNGKDYVSASSNAATVLDSLDDVKNPLQTNDSGYVEWNFNAETEGLYQVEICYYPTEGKGNEIERSISINGETQYNDLESIKFKRLYSNKYDEFVKDKSGNCLRPVQVENPMFIKQVLTGSGFQAKKSLFVKLAKGLNTVRITSIKEPMAISYIRFFNTEDISSYSTEKDNYPKNTGEVEPIIIEGESATLKSDAVLYATDDRSSPMNSPSSVSNIVINSIGGSYWSKPKMWIEWDFNVEKTGIYKMYIRGKQDQNAGIISYRKLTIDNELPFAEADELSFNYKNGWQMFEIGDTENGAYTFYLEKGKHTLRLENNVGQLSDILEKLNDVVVGLNSCYRQIFMLTGSYPDSDRDYSIETSLPDLKPKLEKLAKELKNVKEEFFALTNTKGTAYSTMDKMQVQLDSFVEDMETIPSRLDVYRTNIGNVSDLLLSATEQPLLIDWIKFTSVDEKTPKSDANIFSKFVFGMKSFFTSFVMDYNSISSGKEDDNTIDLWLGSTASAVGTGRDQAQALQALIENTFSNDSGINVNIRLVDVSVLLPAVSSGRGPDVVVGLANNLPMNYAYRNAVYKLSSFPDYEEVAARFNPQSLNQFRYRDDVYALPDKYTFYMMFYRKDILDELGLAVPQTWNEVYELLPKLQNKYMEIGVPNLSDGSIDLFTTLLFQEGGNVYDDDLTKSVLDSSEAITAFKKFTDFYTKYKVNQKINYVSRFRTGEAPIVFVPYTFYTTLQAAAPEIDGLWDFTLMPGTVRADGTIDRTTTATATGALIFSNSEKPDQSWEFLKWWTSAETQAAYGLEIENIQGPAGRHAPATIAAMEKLPWTSNELSTIMEEYDYTKSVGEAPGGYMMSRYVITAASLVINNGLVPRESIIDYNKMINDEVQTMRKKFGLED